ncbi:MAG TPA: VWA domain-containing protein, partial [Caldimonas sp.]|nr:VWA domain-containing protein [Caldimonas sp.]
MASPHPFLTFLWPNMLWAMLAVPVLVVVYLFLLTRRRKSTLRYGNLALVKEALGRGGAWRRHVPPLLMLAAISALLFASSRPAALITLPSAQETIVLAMDVSGSMRAADVLPSRLVAAQEAAKTFVSELPRNVKIAVVSFAGTAAVVQAPTLSRDDVYAAIDRFQLQRGTAIGSGIVLSLATLFPEAGIDLSQITGEREMPPGPNDAPRPEFTPVPPGSYPSAAIILLTDGQRTTGPDSLDAAKMAADRGIRVYTVGIGTREGETIQFEGWSMRVRLDE